MSELLEDKIKDIAVWFVQNRNRIPRENLAKRCDFLEKALSAIIEAGAITARDIQDLENRPLRKRLWLPESVSIDGQAPIRLR